MTLEINMSIVYAQYRHVHGLMCSFSINSAEIHLVHWYKGFLMNLIGANLCYRE